MPEEKCFAPLGMYIYLSNLLLILMLKSSFSHSSFSSFSNNTCFIFFRFVSLSSKSDSFTKSVISGFVVKFTYSNLAVKFPAVNLINSCIVINLLRSGSSIFFSISAIFVL